MSVEISRSPLKTPPLREAGQSIRESIIDLVIGRLLPSLWLCSILWVLVLETAVREHFRWTLSARVYEVVAVAVSFLTALQFTYSRRRLRSLELGRDGERLVAQFLDRALLPLGARVLHDIPADGFNLDHVVIAPQGVFVIETKTRSKPPRVDARVTLTDEGLLIAGLPPDRDPITQVVAASRWVSGLLEESTGQRVAARGVILFPNWYIEPMTRHWLNAQRPWVLEPKALPAFLRHEPPILSEREVTMFANHLARYVRAHQEAARNQ
jgi:hypothetical protein